jgi:hypothetical protein
VQNTRRFVVLAIGEAMVLIAYVLGVVVELDALSVALRVVAVAGAMVVALTLYQSWSGSPTMVNFAAMAAALIGGAAVASTAVSATGDDVFASVPVATAGTAALLISVVLAQSSLAQSRKSAS